MQLHVNIDNSLEIFNVAQANSESSISYLIKSLDFLPEFLKESERINTITTLYDTLISKESLVFENIQQAYYDGIYKLRDYGKLSIQAKLNIISELGFTYITDILSLDDSQLTKLLTFFNLIYLLKGKDEGLRLCLSLLNMDYSYIPWDVVATLKGSVPNVSELPSSGTIGDVYQITSSNSYYMFTGITWYDYSNNWQQYQTKRKRFTAELNIIGALTEDEQNKLKIFLRSYMLPWIDITFKFVNDPVAMYVWSGPGILNKQKYTYENYTMANLPTT